MGCSGRSGTALRARTPGAGVLDLAAWERALESDADLLEGGLDIGAYHIGFEVEDAVAHAVELEIAAGVEGLTGAVVAAIDFDDEACAGGYEIHDETPERHLAAEIDVEAVAAEVGPEGCFGGGEVRAMLECTQSDEG